MPHLVLESEQYGVLSLNGLVEARVGVQATAGATGLGLPPVQAQFREGVGDGAVFRGRRVLSRDIDVPLFIKTEDRDELKATMSQLALILSGEVTLRFVEDDSLSWFVKAHRIGGGEYVYGQDTTGEDHLMTVITFKAGDPYWSRSEPSSKTLRAASGRGLLDGSLSALRVSGAQAIGSLTLSNPGDADAYPVWEVKGPGSNFVATMNGQTFAWNGTLSAGKTLTIDTFTGLVRDSDGLNRYSELAPAPLFWTIPPGTGVASASLANTDATSEIKCTWRPRKWLVI